MELRTFFCWNWKIVIQENAFENVICKMSAILLRPPCVDSVELPSYLMLWTVINFNSDADTPVNMLYNLYEVFFQICEIFLE